MTGNFFLYLFVPHQSCRKQPCSAWCCLEAGGCVRLAGFYQAVGRAPWSVRGIGYFQL